MMQLCNLDLKVKLIMSEAMCVTITSQQLCLTSSAYNGLLSVIFMCQDTFLLFTRANHWILQTKRCLKTVWSERLRVV